MKKQLLVLGTIVTLALSGCGTSTNDENKSSDNMNSMNHEQMNHSSSGEVPQGLKVAENPTYKVGTQATIKASHMAGMNEAKATIVGAYDTTAYVVSYTPTTGGAKVNNHKWVIQEEIENAGDKTLEPGTEVTLKADHMEGMNGAKATIDSAEKTTVYMVDYTTTDGEQVKNHKWVTESELLK
ncbi:YdhK family protein [Ectobacillus funiculus]|uniref:YdhK family protein n=1 Tax=Ectobacillus funiculus TaxID=137993 RepID=A0ABV5WEP1_9BACI